MFVSKNQIFVFFACVAIGGIGGILFTVSALLKFFIKNRRLKFIPDIASFCAFTCFYVGIAYSLRFPSHRIYMTAGAILGLFLYMKSFHIMLALFAKKIYNIIVKAVIIRKIKRKASAINNVGNNERRKRNGCEI